MLARTAPEGLNAVARRTRRTGRVDPFRPGQDDRPLVERSERLVCADHQASAPAASACGGRSGWKPEVPGPGGVDDERHPVPVGGGRKSAGIPIRPDIPGRSPGRRPPTGRPRGTGHRVGTDRERSPVRGSTEGVTQEGRGRPDQPEEHRAVQGASDDDPVAGPPHRQARPGCRVDPPTEKRATSAPQARAASSSAWSSTPELSFTCPGWHTGDVTVDERPEQVATVLVPGMVNGCSGGREPEEGVKERGLGPAAPGVPGRLAHRHTFRSRPTSRTTFPKSPRFANGPANGHLTYSPSHRVLGIVSKGRFMHGSSVRSLAWRPLSQPGP